MHSFTFIKDSLINFDLNNTIITINAWLSLHTMEIQTIDVYINITINNLFI